MNKRTLYGAEAREKILAGVRKISAAVKVTLGPLGRNVLIAKQIYGENYVSHSLPVHITKDGYTTAKGFDLEDSFEKVGVLMVKEAAQKTVDQAGDGTTTTVVLLEAIVEAGIKMIEAGANPIQLKREIDDAVAYVVDDIKERSVQVGNDNDKIFNIATISANNDPEIGRMIADAYKQIGKDGIIDLEASQSVNTEIKIAEGYRFARSWESPLFITNKEKQIIEYENPMILLYEKMIIHHDQIMNALQIAMKSQRPLVVICEGGKEEGLAFMIINYHQGKAQSCIVKAPSFGEARRLEMEDIAVITGGTYITDTKGVGIKEMEYENFGQAKKIIINKDETIIIGGKANGDALEKLLNELKMDLTRAKNENEAAPIEARIAKLEGGVAVIQVGAPTETELKERLDRFDDAVRATKSAIAEGYVAGAGSLFFDCGAKMKPLTQGKSVIKEALMIPFKQICDNAGVDYFSVSSGKKIDFGHGYNAKTDKWVDLVKDGVIDPAKVLRCCIQNAASAASMILTTECVIADTP